MKETIEYNYNIEIDKLDESLETYSFRYINEIFLFCPFKRNKNDINELVSCSNELKNLNIPCFEMMQDKNGKELVVVDGEEYVLLKILNTYSNEVDLIDMIEISKKTRVSGEKLEKYKNNWGDLWSQKVDYFEYQVAQLGHGKDIIIDSFSYFIGLAENAITMVNKCNKKYEYGKDDNVCLSHRRIFSPNYVLNYHNPISFLLDLEVRDFAEYIKSSFYNNENAILEVETYLKSRRLSIYSYQMFYARLIFPSTYFDLYENAINDKSKEEDIIHIIKSCSEYEKFLADVLVIIRKYVNIEGLTWIN
ncbi:MAG: hypothetical protein R3Y13_04365 [bacterium]